jgi:hypothetical protein
MVDHVLTPFSSLSLESKKQGVYHFGLRDRTGFAAVCSCSSRVVFLCVGDGVCGDAAFVW